MSEFLLYIKRLIFNSKKVKMQDSPPKKAFFTETNKKQKRNEKRALKDTNTSTHITLPS